MDTQELMEKLKEVENKSIYGLTIHRTLESRDVKKITHLILGIAGNSMYRSHKEFETSFKKILKGRF